MSRRPRELSPMLALCGAIVGHALVLATTALFEARSSVPAGLRAAPAVHEIDILDPGEARDHAGSPSAAAAVASRADTGRRSLRGPRLLPEATDSPLDVITAEPEAETGPPAPSVPRRKPVDLGLGGGIARQLMLDDRRAPRSDARPSPGLLQEGLDARAAARGAGRSAAAISAAQGAASLGPLDGSAVFDVRADRHGNVVAVTLVSFGASEAGWTRVADDLRRKLAKRKLRVPSGSTGLVTRLRIERGALAREIPSRERTRRGAAIGQDSLGERDVRDESTRASLEPGRISPATRIGTGSGGGGHPTRVILVSERLL